MRTRMVLVCLVVAVLSTTTALARPLHGTRGGWTRDEVALLRSLTLSSLSPLHADPSNRFADDSAAVRLGHSLFFDTRLSGNGQVACATCHMPDNDFQDGRALGRGVGTAGRRTMPIAGTAHSPWQFWDGRADSQWAQALGPLESAVEHGGDRVQYAATIAKVYRREYENVFGPLPDLRGLPERAGPVADSARSHAWKEISPVRQQEITRVYANMGKAIAAYERRISFAPSRFDRYSEAEVASRPHTSQDSFTVDEREGLRLFMGKANCVNCHNGALFTDNHFHNAGVPQSTSGAPNDSGRTTGVRQAMESEFSCLGRFSDATPEQCEELRFAVTEGRELIRAYKTPSLRNVAGRAPYMHAGQFHSLRDVLAHYNTAAASPAGKSELTPLRLSTTQLRQLEAFLNTLTSPLAAPAALLASPPLDGRRPGEMRTP